MSRRQGGERDIERSNFLHIFPSALYIIFIGKLLLVTSVLLAMATSSNPPATRRRQHHVSAPRHSKQVHLYCMCARPDPPHNSSIQLPIALQQAVQARQSAISNKIRITYCEVKEISSGVEEVDVLIFPNFLQYKGITASDVESFVEEVVVQGNEWTAKMPEKLIGVHVFICARSVGSTNQTPLSDIFLNEVATRRIDQVMTSKCTHIYGDKYKGNVVVYIPDLGGEYWYEYRVQEADIPLLVDEIICQIKDNWRHVHELPDEAQNGDDQYAGAAAMSSLSRFASWVRQNVPWETLVALGATAALIGFSLSRKSK